MLLEKWDPAKSLVERVYFAKGKNTVLSNQTQSFTTITTVYISCAGVLLENVVTLQLNESDRSMGVQREFNNQPESADSAKVAKQ